MTAWRLAVVLAMVLLGPVAAHAFTCDASGCTWGSAYTEPSKLTNGQSITDLTGCALTYTTSMDGVLLAGVRSFVVPASKPAGGGAISIAHSDATMLPGHVYTISESVTCTSTAFGVSGASPSGSLQMPNGVAPNPTAAPVLQ